MVGVRTVSRASALVAVACLSLGAWLGFVAPDARALERDGFTISQDQTVVTTYGPIVVGSPSHEVIPTHTPMECVAASFCDSIPVEVIAPIRVTEDGYYIRFQVGWDAVAVQPVPTVFPNGYASNDLDVFVYTDPPTADEARSRGHIPDSEDDPFIASSEGGIRPEVFRVTNPLGRYWLVVVNYLGANDGYEVTAMWESENYPTPFESLAPIVPTSRTSATPRRTTPSATQRGPGHSAPAAEPAGQTRATLAPVAIEPDADFDPALFADTEFEAALAAPKLVSARSRTLTVEDPSIVALLLWLIALPCAAVAVGGAVVIRTRANDPLAVSVPRSQRVLRNSVIAADHAAGFSN